MNPISRCCRSTVRSPFDLASANSGCTLVITGSAPELQTKWKTIGGQLPIVVLGCDARSESGALPAATLDLIADTIRYREVRSIVVCGHSSDASCPPVTQFAAANQLNCYNEMLQPIRDRMRRQQRALVAVRKKVDQINADAKIAQVLRARCIGVVGMFYIQESDLFLIYDTTQAQFVPVLQFHPASKRGRFV